MANDEFQVGDTVRLKSEGPVMTVDMTPSQNDVRQEYYCVWFSDKKEKREEYFPEEALEKAEPASGKATFGR